MMKKYDRWLPVYILMALGVGIVLGRWCVGHERVGEFLVPVASWMGTSFMNLLKVLVIPLVFSSLVSGVMNLGSGRHVGRLGAKTLGLYMLTTLIAVVTGLVLVDTIRPERALRCKTSRKSNRLPNKMAGLPPSYKIFSLTISLSLWLPARCCMSSCSRFCSAFSRCASESNAVIS